MIRVNFFYNLLKKNDISFFTGVPDSLLKDICAFITDHSDYKKHIIAANEGTAVGIACGYYLATNSIPLVYMQNSGLGNAVNPLLSLADEQVFSIPLLLMIGWRGEPGTKDEPQHKKQGLVTLDLLNAMQIPYIVLSDDEDIASKKLLDLINACKESSRPHAIVVRKGVFEEYNLQNSKKNGYSLSREEALKTVIDSLQSTDLVISTTGKLSRELFEYRESLGQDHDRDFLTVGSMGHSSSIALGIALEKPERTIYCLDGDGAFLMHMGAVSNIGTQKPANFRHIVFNNGVHESVGAQPTVGHQIDMISIVKSCGYLAGFLVNTKEELSSALEQMKSVKGPVFMEIKVNFDSRSDLGRPKTTPAENKELFKRNLFSGH